MGRAPRTQRDSDERRRGRAWVRGVWVVVVYLCWGFGLTWAVAWGVAWAVTEELEQWAQALVESDHQPTRCAVILSQFGTTMVYVPIYEDWYFEITGVRWSTVHSELPWFAEHAVPLSGDMSPTGPFFVAASGWPWRALALEVWKQDSPTNSNRGMPDWEEDLRGAVVVSGGRLRGRARYRGNDLWLPLLPLWRGLIANVLFYALLVWGLRRGFVLLRGRRRRRRGRCWVRGGCGYDLTGLDAATCPECGRPVASAPEPDAPARSQLP